MWTVESWLNETTTCTFPDPWRPAPVTGDTTFAELWTEDDEDLVTSQPTRAPPNPFHKLIGKKSQPTIKRALSDYAGSYGHLAFGLFTIYEDEESGALRYRFGALLKGELVPTETADEFLMTVEYPISYRSVFYPQYPDGYPVYFSDVDTVIDKVSVPYLEFDQPPVFETGVVPPSFP